MASPRSQRPFTWAALVLLVSFLLVRYTNAAIKVDYCATMNTEGSTPGNYSIYQSQGLCRDWCKAKSAGLAIVESNYCWCSGTAPSQASQLSTGDCQEPCPGYPSDICGAGGTFVYMVVGAVTATATGGSTPTATKPSETEQSQGGTKGNPIVQTVTADGVVRTVTSTPGADQGQGSSGGGGGLSAGAAAGIAVAVVAIFAIGGIIGFIILRRRRRRNADAMFDSSAGSPSGAAAGMLQVSPGSAAAGSSRLGRRGTGTESDNSAGRRSSTLMPSDPRMNPVGGLYARPENKSHDSFLSMQDNQDYSRPVHEPKKVLRVTNADPE